MENGKRPMWEYEIVAMDNISPDSLNKQGNEGWEFVGIIGQTQQGAAVLFKRPTSVVKAASKMPASSLLLTGPMAG